MSRDIECPYCGAELDVCHDDGQGYAEGVLHEMQCDKCEKNFVFQTLISFYYEPEKADCLNGSPHEYKITKTHPIEFSMMRCSTCSDERDLTEEERAKYNIPTRESLWKTINEDLLK